MKKINFDQPLEILGEDLVSSFKETGFAKISVSESVNHLWVRLMPSLYNTAGKFFAQPVNVKKRVKPVNERSIGYFDFGTEHAKDNPNPDQKEFVDFDMSLNTLPASLYQDMRFVYQLMDSHAKRLIYALDVVLGTDMASSVDPDHEASTIVRLLHYPKQDVAPPPGHLRSAPHEDINLITLLPWSNSSGLQIKLKDGTWMPVRAEKDEILVNVGDMLQNITNGLLPSTTHQVVNPTSENVARFSLPMFVSPKLSTDLTPGEKYLSRGDNYLKITAGEYLNLRLKEIGIKK